MRILVIGSGGREHALVWKLSQSPKVSKLYCAPGNGGIAELAECVPIEATDVDRLVSFAQQEQIDLTVVGPEASLMAGVANAFAEQGLRIFGPTREAAQIEGSKGFAKDLMKRWGIPTAHAEQFAELGQALAYIYEQGAPIVVKADGLAAGKGVTVARTVEEAEAALRRIMEDRAFAEAGDSVVIEEYLEGQELSLMAFVDGETVVPMVPAQDHKPVHDGDRGPNTGGMGAYSPVPQISASVINRAIEEILIPAAHALKREGLHYKGVLYAGLMITEDGPKVIEFNARFGDPETQVVLPRLKSDLVELLQATTDGTLHQQQVEWTEEAALCVVMASGGYPGKYEKGKEITGLGFTSHRSGEIVFHAGTRLVDGKTVTDGGRVLAVTSLGKNLAAAREAAYQGVQGISFEKAHYRRDIGEKALKV
ncbi:phosphoribosylamine--glycine ligase [Marinithermofilum abyssi]|uniref:Phosphoribosylamine--glycine ligase n=1 Tax=Marinithermofilum abyssi TaxID=1571185 RepID=A0A8J2VGU4_9BACL|nr:phosphoribosylamine--glycine ligase [Marinithermofilum abyssi]GGE09790.1 phosphoribosylamine--glycine ligase [Marinithermofilum abyssi]